MRLHRLTVQNLASLQSQSPIEIDFDEGLHGASLFAIVGQTGAGKSTILDAIQLALFGRTARLTDGQHSSKAPSELSADDTRQLISRGAKLAHVTLEFGLLDGDGVARRYRATWSCRRLAKNFEAPTRTLAEYNAAASKWGPERGGSQKKEYQDEFNTTLGGMTVAEFNRTILLAQGQFAALLHANEKDRVALLEKVTQTEKFRAIGARAAAKHKQSAEDLANARAALGALQVPAEGAEDELLAAIAELEAQIAALDSQLKQHLSWIGWLEKHKSLGLAETGAQAAVLAVAGLREQAAEQLLRLHEWRAAVDAFAAIDNIAAFQRSAHKLEAERATSNEERAVVGARALAQRAATTAARDTLAAAREQRDAAAPEIAESRAAWAAARQYAAQYADAAREHAAAEQSVANAQAKLANAETTAVEVAEALAAHDATETARTQALTLARAAADSVRGAHATLDDAHEHQTQQRDGAISERQLSTAARDQLALVEEATNAANSARQKLEASVAELSASAAAIEECETALHAAGLAEQSAKSELALVQRIVFYVEDRAKLADGETCPLCGSRDHEIEALEHRGDAEQLVARAVAAVESATIRWKQVDTKHRELGKRKAAAEAMSAAARELVSKASTQCELAAAKLATFIAQLGVGSDAPDRDALTTRIAIAAERVRVAEERLTEIQKVRKALSVAETAAAQARDTRAALESRQASAEAARTAARTTLDDARAALAERAAALQTASSAVEAAQSRCNELLGGRDPQSVDDELQRACTDAQTAVETATTLETQTNEKLAAIDALIEQLGKQLVEKHGEVETAEAALGVLLSKLGLARETVERRRLTADERGSLESLEKQLDRDESAAAGALRAATEQLNAHRASPPADLDLEQADVDLLREASSEYETARIARLGDRGALQAKYTAAVDARARGAEFADRVRAAEDEHQAWSRLHQVIGINNGGAFATFAQSLGLEELLWQANEQLAYLNGRYTFVRTSGLEFGVRDHDQLDELRPLSTLSGGETFLCSLALALGLARWRVSSIPIETLLLDEGFGTLDGDTLSVAMAALQRLCSSGNMRVGVVTHVEAMRERIDARIVVEKTGGGRSVVRLETGLR
jgi:exonuclease SbcC